MSVPLPSLTVSQMFGQKIIRPVTAATLYGIAFIEDRLIAIDTVKGHLLEIDPLTDNSKIINSNPKQLSNTFFTHQLGTTDRLDTPK